MTKDSDLAVVMIAHGTRQREDSQVVFTYARELEKELHHPVFVGFGEMLEPTTPEAIESAVNAGARMIKVLPYFLFNSSHVKKDLGHAIEVAKQQFPQCQFVACQPLEYHPQIVAVLKERIQLAS